MAEGQGMLNGVVAGGSRVDNQLPYGPAGVSGTTGSRPTEQGSGTDAGRMRLGVDGSTGPAAVVAGPVGLPATMTPSIGVFTGPGANLESGPGANARRFQGEAFGLRNRRGTQATELPQHHDIATPPQQPVAPAQQPPDLQLPAQQLPAQQPPAQQLLTQQFTASQLPVQQPPVQQPTPTPQPSTQMSSSQSPVQGAPRDGPESVIVAGDQGPVLAQRAALVTALHARAARMIGSPGVGEGDVVATFETSEASENQGDQMVWFSRVRGLIQRGLEPVFGRFGALPTASPTSWYSQSPTWSITTPVFPASEQQQVQGGNELLRRPQQPLATEPRGDQSSTGSIQPEVVQEEVKKAVQIAMQQRDSRVADLQSENQELKQLLMAMIEASSTTGGAGGDQGLPEEEGPGSRMMAQTAEPGQTGRLNTSGRGDPGTVAGGRGAPPSAPPGLPVPSRRGAGDPAGQREGEGLLDTLTQGPPMARIDGGGHASAAGKPETATGPDLQGQVGTEGRRERENGDATPTSPLDLLAQGIQQLQQLQLRKDGHEPELLKGSLDLPKLPEPYQDASAVAFLEWIYEAGQVIGSITDRASTWWAANVDLAMEAYHRFQTETPLKRLAIQVGEDNNVDGDKWSRLEKRVMALLLSSMTATIKAEATMLRISRVKDCLFKLYTVYAPGGASERASLIKQLEYIQPQGNIVEAIASLRRWKKQLGRAAEMGISLPDGSVLLMALEGATKQITEGNKDISFKLNMAKNELGLPHKPTLSSVLTYSDHIAAELQQVIPFNKEHTAKLKAATTDAGSPTSSATSPSGKGQGQKQPCKFWLTDEGCRRGAGCKYGHVFQSKEDKKARCWTCGATTHRQSDCPTRSGGKKGKKDGGGNGPKGGSTSSTTSASPAMIATLNNPQPSTATSAPTASATSVTLEHPAQQAPVSTASTTFPTSTGTSGTQPQQASSGSSSAASTIVFPESTTSGEVRELAEQFLAKIKRLAPMQAQTDDAVMDLELLLRSQGFEQHQGMALLDSGASHAYRAPRTVEETRTAKRVRVQLADGRAVYLRQNPGGTLLSEEESGGTILPLGSLVESLGCRLEWNRRHGLQVHHPRYGLLPTKLIGNTPMLRETEALQLIADMEQVEMDKLEANVTEGAIRTLSVDEAPATWLDHLEEFISKGERACLRRMLLDEESPVKALSEQEVNSLLGVEERLLLSDDAGVHYLKALPVNRAMRKRLLRTRWVVHLYNGDEQGPEFARAESDDVTVIRMDMKDSKAYDLRLANGAVRALMWAAARGQIEAVLGAPPRGTEHSSLLFKRMMLLWLVANSGAVLVCSFVHLGTSDLASLLDQLSMAFLQGRTEVS